MAAVISVDEPKSSVAGHARWVRVSHWILAVSVLTLAFSGFEILMVHPRLYWGKVGNDLTPALIELPISRNYKHGGWAPPVTLVPGASPIVTRVRTYAIFNQNGWGRSLHFLAAWFLMVTGLIYIVASVGSGHLWRHLVPHARELAPRRLWQDIATHLHLPMPTARGGPPYGPLRHCRSGRAAAHAAHGTCDVASGHRGLSGTPRPLRRIAVCTDHSLLRVRSSRTVSHRARHDGGAYRGQAPDARYDLWRLT